MKYGYKVGLLWSATQESSLTRGGFKICMGFVSITFQKQVKRRVLNPTLSTFR